MAETLPGARFGMFLAQPHDFAPALTASIRASTSRKRSRTWSRRAWGRRAGSLASEKEEARF
jgi:hypothetical protein